MFQSVVQKNKHQNTNSWKNTIKKQISTNREGTENEITLLHKFGILMVRNYKCTQIAWPFMCLEEKLKIRKLSGRFKILVHLS